MSHVQAIRKTAAQLVQLALVIYASILGFATEEKEYPCSFNDIVLAHGTRAK